MEVTIVGGAKNYKWNFGVTEIDIKYLFKIIESWLNAKGAKRLSYQLGMKLKAVLK